MRIIKGITIFIIGFVVALTTQVPLSLAASEYPNRYIEVIVPYPPGGPSDIASKMFKEDLGTADGFSL
jgi:tripartite-type tricarboxylate transporter receptor subunit TctC